MNDGVVAHERAFIAAETDAAAEWQHAVATATGPLNSKAEVLNACPGIAAPEDV